MVPATSPMPTGVPTLGWLKGETVFEPEKYSLGEKRKMCSPTDSPKGKPAFIKSLPWSPDWSISRQILSPNVHILVGPQHCPHWLESCIHLVVMEMLWLVGKDAKEEVAHSSQMNRAYISRNMIPETSFKKNTHKKKTQVLGSYKRWTCFDFVSRKVVPLRKGKINLKFHSILVALFLCTERSHCTSPRSRMCERSGPSLWCVVQCKPSCGRPAWVH